MHRHTARFRSTAEHAALVNSAVCLPMTTSVSARSGTLLLYDAGDCAAVRRSDSDAAW